MAALDFSYDKQQDIMTIEGIKYSGEVFREFGIGPTPARWLRIIKLEDGVLHVEVKKDESPKGAV